MAAATGATWIQSGTYLGGYLQGYAIAADPANPGHVWTAGDRGGLWEVTFDDSLVPGVFSYYQAGTLPATGSAGGPSSRSSSRRIISPASAR